MTRAKQLSLDLEHIPRATKGSPQNMLRECYTMTFKLSLGKTRSLALAIALAQTQWPDFTPEFDHAYFGV